MFGQAPLAAPAGGMAVDPVAAFPWSPAAGAVLGAVVPVAAVAVDAALAMAAPPATSAAVATSNAIPSLICFILVGLLWWSG
jgi:hypothetical protein